MGNCLSSSTQQLTSIPAEEGVKLFTMAELKKATNDFGEEMVIGDSFGKVVKGYINPKTLSPAKEEVGMAVAVKRFHLTNEQALQDWLVGLRFSRLNSHPSLVNLIGYALDGLMLFSVSEYFPNGLLETHICRETRPRPLPWETRLKISIGAAQSLAFLHSKTKDNVSRRYFSASKILLDSEFNARVAYFGLKWPPSHDDGTYVSSSYADEPTRFHYAPPEYICLGKLQMSGDVYSFGVILLEILTGLGKLRIVQVKQAIRYDKENIAGMIDPDLENSYPLEAGRLMCEIIKQCLEEDPEKRPSMEQVVENLNFIAQI